MFEKLGLKSAILVGAFSVVACGGECGDGVIDEVNDFDLAEACDDGNTAAGDGCNATCGAVEDGFDCLVAGQACVPTCGNGALDAGEECDGAVFDPAISCADFLATGNLSCNADCSVSGDSCVAQAGDGIRSSDLIIPGQGEECDDGNLTAGDGCAPDMTLEALSDITVNANEVQLNNQNTDAATFSVFAPMVGLFGQGQTSLLFVVTTDNAAICDVIFASGGFNGFLDNLFGIGADAIIGTTVLTMISQPAADGNFITGTFTGTDAGILAPGVIGTDSGFTVVDGAGAILSDTTFGTDGLGVINLTTFNTVDIDTGLVDQNGDPVLRPAGNLELDFANVNQTIQFILNGATADVDSNGDGTPDALGIATPISGNITAASCSLDVF